jgi:hypothetical protein
LWESLFFRKDFSEIKRYYEYDLWQLLPEITFKEKGYAIALILVPTEPVVANGEFVALVLEAAFADVWW